MPCSLLCAKNVLLCKSQLIDQIEEMGGSSFDDTPLF
jgi:hypothetical protein